MPETSGPRGPSGKLHTCDEPWRRFAFVRVDRDRKFWVVIACACDAHVYSRTGPFLEELGAEAVRNAISPHLVPKGTPLPNDPLFSYIL
jgi:hypothetical protein